MGNDYCDIFPVDDGEDAEWSGAIPCSRFCMSVPPELSPAVPVEPSWEPLVAAVPVPCPVLVLPDELFPPWAKAPWLAISAANSTAAGTPLIRLSMSPLYSGLGDGSPGIKKAH